MTWACIATGTQKSVGQPIQSPVNSRGVTPMMSNVVPFSVNVRPITSRARSNRRAQYASLMTATG